MPVRSFVRACAVLVAAVAAAPLAHAQMTPLQLTGFNRDIVVENTATPPFTAVVAAFDVPNNWAFYESGLAGGTKGFPAGGAFTSTVDPTTSVQLQPFTGPNALFMNAAGPTGTLTLLPAAQRPYNRLAIIASSANGQATSTGTVVLNFADSTSSSPISYNASDWFFVAGNNAINNLGRANTTNGFDDGSAGNPRLYQTTLDLVALGQSTKTIVSFTFTRPANAGTSIVMAVSGEVNSTTPGVCCNNDGTCSVIPQASCTGAFHAEWATCAVAQCPQPGACCFPDGTCTRVQQAACLAASGEFQTAGSVCQPNPCPQPGACCFDDGHCTLLLQAACAASSGGPVFGGGPVCQPNTCPQLSWACCLSDGSCISLMQAACASNTGTWRPGSTCGTLQCPPPNLLTNPGAETDDNSGWVIDTTGGNGIATSFDTVVHSGNHAFAFSYALSTRHQTVDLLAAGFSAETLDSSPTITFSEWIGTRGDQAGQYFLRFELLDANMQVIDFFEDGSADLLNPVAAQTPYFERAHTFTGYPAGVRFLNFIDGGRDQSGWAGNYGIHFDDALAAIIIPSACCNGAACTIVDRAACLTAGGTVQAGASTCSPNPCGGGSFTGACCSGSSCALATAITCNALNTHFAGPGTVCNTGNNTTTPCCKANFNQDAGISVQDIFDFLTAWFNGSAQADLTGDGLSVQDIFDFLTAWFNGC